MIFIWIINNESVCWNRIVNDLYKQLTFSLIGNQTKKINDDLFGYYKL